MSGRSPAGRGGWGASSGRAAGGRSRSAARGTDRGPSGASDDDISADPEGVARTLALRLLEHSPRTRHELTVALSRRGVPDDATAAVLDRFADVGLIDDAAFATAWVDSRHRGRGLARNALGRELRHRGVDDELTRDAVSAVSDDDEQAAARALVERKLRAMSRLTPAVRQRRLAAMLGRRGFSGDVARRVIADAQAAADD